MSTRRIAVRAALMAVAGAVAAAMVMGTAAYAEPSFTPDSNDFTGVGSDTTQDVLNQFQTDYNATSPSTRLANYDARRGSTTIGLKSGCTAINRPDGSSAGINALIANTQSVGGFPCLDYARSSRVRNTGVPAENNLVFIGFARGALTFVAQATTNAPVSLTKLQLRSIYNCTADQWSDLGFASTNVIKPYLPQAGSGTRSTWLSKIGVTDAVASACVGTKIHQEHDGAALPIDPDVIAPYDVAQYICQRYKGTCTDRHGTTELHQVDGYAPTTGSGVNTAIRTVTPDNGMLRTVFNVVRAVDTNGDGVISASERTTIPTRYRPIFGTSAQGGYICTHQSVITNFGFALLGTNGVGCGTA